jgi:hypothetical protein
MPVKKRTTKEIKKQKKCKHEWKTLKIGVKCTKCGKIIASTGCCG